MGSTNFIDLEPLPKEVTDAVEMLARNTVHLSKLLERDPYPGKA